MRKLLTISLLGVVLAITYGLHLRATRIAPEAMLGLWSQYPASSPSDELRFYYFHKGGKGVYRYGQVAYNQTHSFDWAVKGNKLELTFRKRGEHATTIVELAGSGDARTLTLLDDPRGEGRVRYAWRPSNLALGPLDLVTDEDPRGVGSAVEGRLWIDAARYATGGMGFSMYQLSQHACAADELSGGRLGWYHRGDFDDWSTETLCYRTDPTALHVRFILRREEAHSPIALAQDGRRRVMTLSRDPRNFLQRSRFADAGPSF